MVFPFSPGGCEAYVDPWRKQDQAFRARVAELGAGIPKPAREGEGEMSACGVSDEYDIPLGDPFDVDEVVV